MPLFPVYNQLQVIQEQGREIYLVDYCGLNEGEMIALTNKHKDLVVAAGRECYFIANYVEAFGTPDYMKAAFEFTKQTKLYIPKGAFLGIYGVKTTLLKGVVYFMNVNFKAFNAEKDALAFLLS